MAHHLQHPSGMPYHIYQNVIGNAKPLAEAAHRAQIATFHHILLQPCCCPPGPNSTSGIRSMFVD